MTIAFRIKFFFQKRLTPISVLKWDLKSMWKGYRKEHSAGKNPIDLGGKQHIHIYPIVACHLDCYFCQNKFYVDKLPKYHAVNGYMWAGYLNRMHGFHHIDWNGGEPMNYPYFLDLINSLHNHNLVVFTNLPHNKLHLLDKIQVHDNNIQFCVSYHPLEEQRDIAEFVADFKRIPKSLHPNVHVIDVPEVSYKNVRSAFAKRGVFIEGLDAIVPTKHNKIGNDFKHVKCKSDMDCVDPELNVFPCTGLMLRQIGGIHIDDYKFKNDYIECDHYGLCGPCAAMKDVREVKR